MANIFALGALAVSVSTLLLNQETSSANERLTQQANSLTAESHFADQLNTATQELGNQTSLVDRIGGISELDLLLDESTQDRQRIIQELADFVRNSDPVSSCGNAHPLPADIQDAVGIIANYDNWTAQNTDYFADLHGTCLAGLVLNNANLSGVNLIGSDLSSSDLTATSLSNANLLKANLDTSVLIHSDFSCAFLTAANLTNSWLIGARLFGTDLIRADMAGARADSADSTDAVLSDANLTGTTGINRNTPQTADFPCIRSLQYQQALMR